MHKLTVATLSANALFMVILSGCQNSNSQDQLKEIRPTLIKEMKGRWADIQSAQTPPPQEETVPADSRDVCMYGNWLKEIQNFQLILRSQDISPEEIGATQNAIAEKKREAIRALGTAMAQHPNKYNCGVKISDETIPELLEEAIKDANMTPEQAGIKANDLNAAILRARD